MLEAKGILHKNFIKGETSGDLFGGFVEHMGRHIYGGLYDKAHPLADEEGFRKDVLALVRELSMPLMRYPGGNFVSGYDWRSGIGPKEKRTPHFDPAWGEVESNEFALDEFLSWCRKSGTKGALALNLGTGTEEMALALLDYCNGKGDTFWSEKRKEYGSCAPYGIQYFFLGNEMSSPRQTGYKKVEEYAAFAHSLAVKLKEKDPSIKLVLSGSSCRNASTYGYWDDRILEECYNDIDLISLHAYFGPREGELASFLASDLLLEKHIEEVCSICDSVKARKKASRVLGLSLDEWNIWSGTNIPKVPGIRDFEDIYTALDAVVMGGLLMTIMDHGARVKLACLAQVCNILAPIMTEKEGCAWRQTIFHPFALSSRYGRGKILQGVLSRCDIISAGGESYPALKMTSILQEEEKALSLFLLNRSWEEKVAFELAMEGFIPEKLLDHFLISAEDPMLTNSPEKENVVPRKTEDFSLAEGKFCLTMPARSWGLFRFRIK